MKKTIIVNDNASNHGKTASIKAIYRRLQQTYPSMAPPYPMIDDEGNESYDIKAMFTIEIEGEQVTIGLESQGDPNSRQPESLNEFASSGCNIIIAASRTRGETVGNIWNIAEEFEYRVIWARNYICYEDQTHDILKEQYVDSVMKLIDQIIGNKL